MFKIRKKAKVDWNLNWEFICWLNKWFKEYKKNASKIVDLEFHKFKYKRKEMTQLEIIDRIIELTDDVSKNWWDFEDEVQNRIAKEIDEIFQLFRIVFYTMWW